MWWKTVIVTWLLAMAGAMVPPRRITVDPAVIADDPDDVTLRCLLAADPNECPPAAPPVAGALLRQASPELRADLASEGLKWAESMTVRSMGPALVALLPPRHLSALPADKAAQLLSGRPDAAGLVAALASAVAHDPAKRTEFLERVSGERLGQRAETLLGEWVAASAPNTTAYDELALLRRAGSGLLASLPAARLLDFTDSVAEGYVFALRSWRDLLGPEAAANALRRAPALSRRAWATLALRVGQLPRAKANGDDAPTDGPQWSPALLDANGFLLEGCTPGEVAPLPVDAAEWSELGAVRPPPLTARALLPAPTTPPPLNFSLLLTPAALARLQPGPALRAAWTPDLARGIAAEEAPLGSARAAAMLLALSAQSEFAPASAAASAAGALAWALPPAQRAQLRALSPAALAAIDSPRFSRLEAQRLLDDARASSPDSGLGAWQQARGLLRGLRAAALQSLPQAQQLPQALLLRLLRNFPSDAPAPVALALLAHARQYFASEPLLNATLQGPGAGVLLAQLSPLELRTAGRTLARLLPTASPQALHVLHERVLWAALDAHLGDEAAPSSDEWTPLLLGLRCEHLRAAGPAGASALLDTLNAQLRAAADRPFPPALRRCARQAMADFLALRAAAHGLPLDAPPMAVLEPRDAETFGGYVVAGVPAAALSSATAPAAAALLSAAGRLQLQELIGAAGGVRRARALALAAAQRFPQDEPLAELTALGSLLWLLPAPDVRRVDAWSLRRLLEALPTAHTRAACSGKDARRAWVDLATAAFGEPKTWTPGTLGALGGLLAAFPTSALAEVPQHAWIDSADVLASAWPFHRAVHTHAHTRTLLAACAHALDTADTQEVSAGAHELARRVLAAAKDQLRSAVPPVVFRKPRTGATDGHVDFVHEPPKIRVLDAEDDAEEDENRRRRRDVGDDLRAFAFATTPASVDSEAVTTATTTHGNGSGSVQATTHQDASNAQPPRRDTDTARNTVLEEDWCGAVSLAGPAAGAALTAPDILAVPPAQLRACAEVLGALRLSSAASAAFWQRAAVGGGGGDGEAGAWAADAGHLLRAVTGDVMDALPLGLLDVQAALARHMATEEQFDVYKILFSRALPSKESTSGTGAEAWGAEAWSAAALAAAGAALCAQPEATLARRAGGRGQLVAAAAALGEAAWPHCPRVCMAALARLLVKGEALGSASRWGAAEASAAGALAAGVPGIWKALSPGAVAGLHPDAVRCIPAPDFQELSESQARALSPSAAAAVSDFQLERVRSQSARVLLQAARADQPPPALAEPFDASAAAPAAPATALTLAITLALAVATRAL